MTASLPLKAEDYPLRPRMTLRVAVLAEHWEAQAGEALVGEAQADARPVLDLLSGLLADRQEVNNERRAQAPYDCVADADLRVLALPDTQATQQAVLAGAEAKLGIELISSRPVDAVRAGLTGDALARFDAAWAAGTGARLELHPPESIDPAQARHEALRTLLSHADVALFLGVPAEGLKTETTLSTATDQAARRSGMIVLALGDGETLHLWQPDPGASDIARDGAWVSVADTGRQHLDRALDTLLGMPKEDPHHGQDHNHGHGPSRTQHDCLTDFYGERARQSSLQIGFNILSSLFGDRPWRPPAVPARYRLAETQADAWPGTREAMPQIGGQAFADALERALRQRWIFADNLAQHFAQTYRTAFVVNFLLSGIAVLIGLLAVLWWDDKVLKAILVSAELCCITIILWKTFKNGREHWHERWLHYRAVAEALRPSRMLAGIGAVSGRLAEPHSTGVGGAGMGESWVDWYVRATMREVPWPTGRLDADTLRRLLDLTITDEIDPQITYHRTNAARMNRMNHKLHSFADRLLWLTIATGLAYLAAFGLYKTGVEKTIIDTVKPVATLLGGVLPTFGAVMFGIRAVGDFSASAHQSERMVAELEALRAQLEREKEAPRPDQVQALLTTMTDTMGEDQRAWSMVYSERELTAGF